MRAPAGIELLPDGTWDCGSTGGEWLPGGCGCGSGGSCGCKGEVGSCSGKKSGGGRQAPRLPDYDGEIWAPPVRAIADRSSSNHAMPGSPRRPRRVPTGIELLPGGTWDCGSTGGEWSPGGCGCGSGGECSCAGPSECGGSCGKEACGGALVLPQQNLKDYEGDIWGAAHGVVGGRVVDGPTSHVGCDLECWGSAAECPPCSKNEANDCPCDSLYWECALDIADIPFGGSEEFCERMRRQATLSCLRYAVCLTEIDHPELCPRVPRVPDCKSCLQQLDDCLRSGAPPAGCGAGYVKCMGCNDKPEKSDSKVCDYPDSYYYSGVKASCMCKCAGESPWSQEGRGCLRCLYDKGVDSGLAHQACYDEATNRGYSMPTATIAACALTCPHRISISSDITDWQIWGWR